jgi:hypothetical protein
MPNAGNFIETRLQQADAVVRSVVLHYYVNKDTFEGVLVGIRFFDVNNTKLLESGYWVAASSYREHIIDLQEDERVIGFKSGRRGLAEGRHFDFQLIIGKMVE